MINKKPTILIVDDEEQICALLCEELTGQGYDCAVASNAADALVKLISQSFDLALLDIKLPGMSGMDLLKTVQQWRQMTAIIMITCMSDADTAVEAMKLGASDYIVKPFTFDKLIVSITAALKKRQEACVVCHTIQGKGTTSYSKNVKSHSLNKIDAIAYGVDAQVDFFDAHTKIVTDKTVELARQLGLPDGKIKKWAVARDKLYSDRHERIKSVLNKLEQSPIAQVMLGLTRPIDQFPESSHKRN